MFLDIQLVVMLDSMLGLHQFILHFELKLVSGKATTLLYFFQDTPNFFDSLRPLLRTKQLD